MPRPKHRRSHNDPSPYRPGGGPNYDNSPRYGQNYYSNYPGDQGYNWRSEPDLYRTSSSSNYSSYYQPSYEPSHHQRWSSGHLNEQGNSFASSYSPHQRQSPPPFPHRQNHGGSDYRRSFESSSSTPSQASRAGPSMDLQMRTLRVTGFHRDVTKELLKELFVQVGPVRNVVLKPDHAFVEFADEESVAYALAAMSNVYLFGRELQLEPKVLTPGVHKYVDHLNSYLANPDMFLQFT